MKKKKNYYEYVLSDQLTALIFKKKYRSFYFHIFLSVPIHKNRIYNE